MITVIVVISSIAIMQHINTSQYAITPGQATPIAPLMKIEGIATEKHLDKIELVDVYLQQLSVWQWIGAQFQSHVAFLPASALVTPGQPTSELAPQGYLEMNDSKQSASVAAFRALGYKVPGTPTGALITGINYPSPAWNANLNIADRIVEVNSTKVTSSCGLISAMHNYAPGQNVVLTIEKSHFSTTGEITWASAKPVTMKLKNLLIMLVRLVVKVLMVRTKAGLEFQLRMQQVIRFQRKYQSTPNTLVAHQQAYQ